MPTNTIRSFLNDMGNDDSSPEVEKILDAALMLFADIGIQRATIGDVANRAGVNRVTVYRRIGSKDDVVEAVIGREATRLFTEIADAARKGKTFEDRVAVSFATTIDSMRNNAVLARLLTLETETILLRLTAEAGPLLTAAVAAVMHIFEEAVEDKLITTTDDLGPRAEVMVRIVHSIILTPAVLVPLKTYDDLVAFAQTHLVPIITRDAKG